MSRITKDAAQAACMALTSSKADQWEVLKTGLSAIVTQAYLDNLPTGIMETFNKYPDYFKTSKSVIVNGVGIGEGHSFELLRKLPAMNYHYDTVSVENKLANVIVDRTREIESLKKEINLMRQEIKNGILALGTFARVQRDFPEAYAVLETPKTTAISLDLSKIRCKINPSVCK